MSWQWDSVLVNCLRHKIEMNQYLHIASYASACELSLQHESYACTEVAYGPLSCPPMLMTSYGQNGGGGGGVGGLLLKQWTTCIPGPGYNAIHRINHYPEDSVVCFVNTYLLDSDLLDSVIQPLNNWGQSATFNKTIIYIKCMLSKYLEQMH